MIANHIKLDKKMRAKLNNERFEAVWLNLYLSKEK